MIVHQDKHQKPTTLGIILAAGKGSRMSHNKPKVLHKLGNKTLIERVANSLRSAGIENLCAVIGQDIESFHDFAHRYPEVIFCIQQQKNGTAGAVAATADLFRGIKPPAYASGFTKSKKSFTHPVQLLICLGDTPLLPSHILADFISHCQKQKSLLGLIAFEAKNPYGYGRVITDTNNRLEAIIEETDATTSEKKINLCNSGIIFADCQTLFSLLPLVDKKNKQEEYYLTDCIKLAKNKGFHTSIYKTKNWQSFLGVNTPLQLQEAEKILKTQKELT